MFVSPGTWKEDQKFIEFKASLSYVRFLHRPCLKRKKRRKEGKERGREKWRDRKGWRELWREGEGEREGRREVERGGERKKNPYLRTPSLAL